MPTTVSYASGPFQYAMAERIYDDERRLHKVKLSLPNMTGRVSTYAYHSQTGRLDSVNSAEYSFHYAYDPHRGMMDRITSHNGTSPRLRDILCRDSNTE